MPKSPAKSKKANRIATLRTERLALAKLRPHPKNPRFHPEPGTPKWEALKASLAHDYFDALVFNKRNGMLVSGHLRTKVLSEMGITHADVVVVDYDEETHVARMVGANRHQGEHDSALLAAAVRDLGGELTLSGLSIESADAILERFDQATVRAQVDGEIAKEEELTKQANSLRARKFIKKACEACSYGGKDKLIVHHVDQNNSHNEDPENIQTLCKPCHDFWHSTAKRLGRPIAGRMPSLGIVVSS